jgi:Transposase DDE domain
MPPSENASASAPGETPSRERGHRVDSQSVKTTGGVGGERGYDGGKKVKGRKRHLLVDTQGLVLKASRSIQLTSWTVTG